MDRRCRPRHLPLWTWVLLAPFVAMAPLSPGTLPGRGVQGTLTLVLCTAVGPVGMQVDPVIGQPVQKDQAKAAAPCQWHMARDPALPLPPFAAPNPASAFVAVTATPTGPPVSLQASRLNRIYVIA